MILTLPKNLLIQRNVAHLEAQTKATPNGMGSCWIDVCRVLEMCSRLKVASRITLQRSILNSNNNKTGANIQYERIPVHSNRSIRCKLFAPEPHHRCRTSHTQERIANIRFTFCEYSNCFNSNWCRFWGEPSNILCFCSFLTAIHDLFPD